MQALTSKVPATKGVARFVFVDDDQRCVDMLWDTLRKAFPQRPRSGDAIPLKIVKGTCTSHLEATLDAVRAWGQPIFANLDSWGNAPVPFRLLQRLAVAAEDIVADQADIPRDLGRGLGAGGPGGQKCGRGDHTGES